MSASPLTTNGTSSAKKSDCVPSFVLAASDGRKRKRSYNCASLFVLAASGDVGDVPLGVIYHLARRNVNGLLIS